jgi:hypothetical protein
MATRKGDKKLRPRIEGLEKRISLSNGNFPPGQFPSGNPLWLSIEQYQWGALSPGKSNPNETPATNPSND